MTVWKKPVTVALLTAQSQNTAVSHLGIEFLEVGDDFIKARVPVDARTRQPYGLLHGGVSVVLAETLGSCAAVCACPGCGRRCQCASESSCARWQARRLACRRSRR